MRIRLAALALAAAIAVPSAAQAREAGLFCLDRAELAANRAGASGVAKELIYNEKSSFWPMIQGYEKLLAAAERGDDAAQRRIGGFWAACVLAGDEMSAAKQTTAAGYLRKAADGGDKQASMYLGQFYALGAGVPADYAQAYPRLLAAGISADAVERTAQTLRIAAAPAGERQAAMIYGQMLRALLKTRLEQIASKVVGDDAVGRSLQAKVAFRTCPNRAEIVQADPALNRDTLQPLLDALAQRLPSAGLPCKNDDGADFAVGLPFSIQRPR